MKQITFSTYWHPKLERELTRRIKTKKTKWPFTMSLTGTDEIKAVELAVNQDIDSHLEACFVPARGDRFEPGERSFEATLDTPYWKAGDRVVHTRTLECKVSKPSLPVLVRRLMNLNSHESSVAEAASSLASGICSCFDIELV